jgi:iron(III) transport system substrate-binding protein
LRRAVLGVLIVFLSLATGCRRNSASNAAQPVVLYTSVDEPYVRPLVEQFTKETGIPVTLVTDAEASKTVGLAERVRAEKEHPRADVWWDNEVFQTVRLADDGLLAPYDSPSASDIPAKFKDAKHLWAGSAIRVRVIVASSSLRQAPRHLTDFLKSDLKGKIVIARPTAGTTGGHVAALYALWGETKADDFFHKLRDNGVSMVGGNSLVAEAVARGDMLLGLCDNDDAADASKEIAKLNVVLPDQDGQGTLAMPCAVALIANGPNAAAGRKLIDFILSSKVDHQLIESKFAWCSARDDATISRTKLMDVDYTSVARTMPAAIRRAVAILDAR